MNLITSGTTNLYRRVIPELAGLIQQHHFLNRKYSGFTEKKLNFLKCTLHIGNMLKRQKDIYVKEAILNLVKARRLMQFQEYGNNMELFRLKIIQECSRDRNITTTAKCIKRCVII